MVYIRKNTENNSDYSFINDKTSSLDKTVSFDKTALKVDKNNKITFTKDVLGSKRAKETLFEKDIKEGISILKTYSDGLPLLYSRKEFLDDINKVLTDKNKLFEVAKKAGVEFDYCMNNNKPVIEGYDGLFGLDKLDKTDEVQKAVYDLAYKFFYENRVTTENKTLNKQLNKIIKGVPEFINCIGKRQHGTHKYSLDIHILLVLAYSINDEEFKNLPPTEKACLKLACIFHDISKKENVVDEGHQNQSSIWAKNIIKRFIKNPELKDRVYEIIKNHHWLKDYNIASDKDEISKKLAFDFRRPYDFEIAKIMARADLMGVSDMFYIQHNYALAKENLEPIQTKLDKMYEKGCAIFCDCVNTNKKIK